MVKIGAGQISVMAITAALYAIFFFLSGLVAVPQFTILYLPVILLGIFPIWFGWSGLVGSMIGGFIGGAFVEGLGFLGLFESVVALIIYVLNWILMPKRAAEEGKRTEVLLLIGVYAFTLFIGTGYILWQYTVFPQLFSSSEALVILLPTFVANFVIEAVACPVLLRTLSPRLRNWGMYSGSLRQWQSRTKKKTI